MDFFSSKLDTPGKRLRFCRGERKQSDVERDTGVKSYNLSNYENDKTDIPISVLMLLCPYYHTSADFILFGKIDNSTITEFTQILLNKSVTVDGKSLSVNEIEVMAELVKVIKIMRKQKEPQ